MAPATQTQTHAFALLSPCYPPAGTPPFNADTPEEIFENILDRRIEWPGEDEMSAECRDLIDQLLEPETEHRLGYRGAGAHGLGKGAGPWGHKGR